MNKIILFIDIKGVIECNFSPRTSQVLIFVIINLEGNDYPYYAIH